MVKMRLYKKISELERFLEPTLGEVPLFVLSIYASIPIGLVTYELTGHNKVYTALGALSPQIAEYIFFRVIEAGALGKGIRSLIKRSPTLFGKFRKINYD